MYFQNYFLLSYNLDTHAGIFRHAVGILFFVCLPDQICLNSLEHFFGAMFINMRNFIKIAAHAGIFCRKSGRSGMESTHIISIIHHNGIFYSQTQIFYKAKTVMMKHTAMTHTHTYYISQTLPVSIADWVIKHYSANCTWPCLYVFDRKLGGQSFFMLFTADPWLLETVMGENTSKYCFCHQIFFSNCPLKSGLGVRNNILSQLCSQWSRISCRKLFYGNKPTMVPQAVSDTM